MLHPLLNALFQATLFGSGLLLGWMVRDHLPAILAALRGRHGPPA